MLKIISLFYRSSGRISTIAIDSTGFTTSYFSYYYSIRAQKERKGFLKVSLAIDTKNKRFWLLKSLKTGSIILNMLDLY